MVQIAVTLLTTHLNTTTIGDSELVITPRPFQIMSPDAITDAKLRTWSKTFKEQIKNMSGHSHWIRLTCLNPSLLKALSSSVNIRIYVHRFYRVISPSLGMLKTGTGYGKTIRMVWGKRNWGEGHVTT